MSQIRNRMRKRRLNSKEREILTPKNKPTTNGVKGGKLKVLTDRNIEEIHKTSIQLLTQVGFSEYSREAEAVIKAGGGYVNNNSRLCFSETSIKNSIKDLTKNIILFSQDGRNDLILSTGQVYFGTGGASPMVRDLENGNFRESSLMDVYNFARLCDRLDNIHFFSRPVVARDLENDDLISVNTAFACLMGTKKHVIVSANSRSQVKQIAKLCFLIAGSREKFLEKPFLSIHVNHVVPPMRFSEDAIEVLFECSSQGIPVSMNTFGQMGASSPVTIAGCLAQTNAETLAGMALAWLINPKIKAVYGARPMVTDLRTGGMAGGSGEQALLTSGSVQMANFYGFSNSTISGATDSKPPDYQSGYEKASNISMAANSGSNLITQAAGTQAGLMVASFESCVIDNDMLGGVSRSLSEIIVDQETLSFELIQQKVNTEGHFLGANETFMRMKTDFLYPEISDRTPYDVWEKSGGISIIDRAKILAKEILETHYPNHVKDDLVEQITNEFDIRLSKDETRKI